MDRPEIEEVKKAIEAGEKYTKEYTFQEVSAPDGYELDKTPIKLTIEFNVKTEEDNSETVVITNATSSSERMDVKDISEDRISIDIKNKEESRLAGAYRVYYNANTTEIVENMPEDQAKLEGIDLKLAEVKPTTGGLELKEWNTKPDGSGTAYQPGDIYNIDEDVTLYAQWQEAQYEVKYEANVPQDENGQPVGVPEEMPETQYEKINSEENIIISEKIPTLEGYTFKEWNTKPDGTGEIYKAQDEYKAKENLTLYAIWEDNSVLRLKSNVYIIGNEKPNGYKEGDETEYKEGTNYILGIMPKLTVNSEKDINENNKGTTIEDFINNITTNAETIEFYDTKGNLVEDKSKLIFTGEKLRLIKGQKQIELTLVVRGDYGDGALKINDYNQLGRYLSNGTSSVLVDVKLKAMDVNLDGRINMRDYNFMASAMSKSDNRELK